MRVLVVEDEAKVARFLVQALEEEGHAVDAAGRVVSPAGSTVELTITEIQPAKNKGQADGKLAFQVAAVTVRGQRYSVQGEVTSVPHTLKGRGVTAGEVEKVGVGTAIGAVAGEFGRVQGQFGEKAFAGAEAGGEA